VATVQPHTPLKQACPARLLEQSMHAAPDGPHAPAVEPAAHTPFEQQAPLHGWLALHAVVHLDVVPSHALPDGQSAAELQPHAPPPGTALHKEPMLLPLQAAQAPPVEPHELTDVPGSQVPPLQQPPWHGCVDEQVVVHWCAVVSHAWPTGQSLALEQPHTPARQAWPTALMLQSLHEAPLAPQVFAAAPALQVVPAQHPPLQLCVEEQTLVHTCPLPHARWVGQSVGPAQPQLPPPVVDKHCPPAVLEVQSAHARPFAPQVPVAVPVTQVPFEQQPPLHGCEGEQLRVHVLVPRLQAWPTAQSLAEEQPHTCVPGTHDRPAALDEQSAHAVPGAPHAVCVVPGWQKPPEQQPPLHGCDDEQGTAH
jgi:hypothetical protein